MSVQEHLPAAAPRQTAPAPAPEADEGGDLMSFAGLLGNSFFGSLLSSEPAADHSDPCAYPVVEGDTLWGIAERTTGSGRGWRQLYDENQDVVGSDPNLIHPGQILDVCPGEPGGQSVEPETAELVTETVSEETPAVEECLPEDEVVEIEAETATCGPQTADEVMGDVTERLVDHDWFGAVTDEEAGEALDMLLCLPPDQQAAAMSQMDDEAFDNLLSEVPEERRGELASLFDNTTDPARKVRLWGEVALANARASHDGAMEDDDNAATDAEEDAIEHRNDVRDATLSATEDEVADEVAVMLARIEAGESVTAADVTALDQRKRLESDIEQRYGINLTNDRGGGGFLFFSAGTDRRVWTEDELHMVEGALGRLPADQVRDNPALEEIHRAAVLKEHDGLGWKDEPNVGGNAGGGTITLFDTGTGYDPSTGRNTTTTPWRTESNSDLANHRPGQTAPNGPLTLVEEVITHEIGHTVHQNDDALWERWQEINGWERLDGGDVEDRLESSGMSEDDAEAEVENLDAHREDFYGSRPTVTRDGKMYEIDPYSGDYLAVDEVAVPGGTNASDWDYARSNPEDHFAEMYAKAVHQPEGLYRDLITEPTAELGTATTRVTDATNQLAALRADPSASAQDIADAEARLAARQAEQRRAQRAVDVRQQQWDFFRTDVFHTDDSDIQALVAPAGKEAVYAEYQSRARMCQTPQQLDALRAEYRDRL